VGISDIREYRENSIQCVSCKGWCHKRCSGLKKLNGVNNFRCPKCKREKEEEGITNSGSGTKVNNKGK